MHSLYTYRQILIADLNVQKLLKKYGESTSDDEDDEDDKDGDGDVD